MSEDAFQVAVRLASLNCSPRAWSDLSATEQSAAIYQELRTLDASTVKRLGASRWNLALKREFAQSQ
jgi:hypothetical protein